MWTVIIWSTEGLNRTEKQRKGGFFSLPACVFELGLRSSTALGLGFMPSVPLVSRTGIKPSALLGLQLADRRSRDFSASIIAWSSSRFHMINLLLCPIAFVSLENPIMVSFLSYTNTRVSLSTSIENSVGILILIPWHL